MRRIVLAVTVVFLAAGASAGDILTYSDSRFPEGSSSWIEVRRSNSEGWVAFSWKIRDYFGRAPAEISPTEGVVTIRGTQDTARLWFTVRDDAVHSFDRKYVFSAEMVAGDAVITPSRSLTVVEDDWTYVEILAPKRFSVREDAGSVVVDIGRRGLLDQSAQIAYAISGNIDSPKKSGNLFFNAGQSLTQLTVRWFNDGKWSRNRTVVISIEGVSRWVAPRKDSVEMTIIDEDPVETPYVITGTTVLETDGLTNAAVKVTAPHHAAFVVMNWWTDPVTANRFVDFQPGWGSLWFAMSKETTLVIPIFGDTEVEDDETLTIDFSYHTSAPPTLPLPPPITVTIVNDDARLAPENLHVPRGKKASLLLDVGAKRSAPLTVPLTSTRPDLVRVPQSVTIPAGASRVPVEVEGIATSTVAARITADVPGFRTAGATVRVYEATQVALAPSPLKGPAGDEVPVRVTVTPSPVLPLVLPLTVVDPSIVSAPSTVAIDSGGNGAFLVKMLTGGSTAIRVRNPDGESEPAQLEVIVDDTASLTAITPPTGATAGGTAFIATGVNLAAGCTLDFGGIPVAGMALGADGALHGVTPAHAPGVVDVVLTCAAARSVLTGAFTYAELPPSIESVTPALGSASGGTLVRAHGAAFTDGCWMFFDGVPATFVDVESPLSLTATTPPHAKEGLVETSIRCGFHLAILPASFTYASAPDPLPAIVSVDPANGAPGESVTIHGSAFRREHVVRFDGIEATTLRVHGDRLVVRIPEHPPGLSRITIDEITGPDFSVTEPLPAHIDTVFPATTIRGSDIVLTGRGFRPIHRFAIGGRTARPISLESDRVALRVPLDIVPGNHSIRIDDTDTGTLVNVTADRLRIQDVTPRCGPTTGGTAVRIVLEPGQWIRSVTFDGVPAVMDPVFSSSSAAIAPPGVTGAVSLAVRTSDVQELFITDAFRYVSPFDPKGCSR